MAIAPFYGIIRERREKTMPFIYELWTYSGTDFVYLGKFDTLHKLDNAAICLGLTKLDYTVVKIGVDNA